MRMRSYVKKLKCENAERTGPADRKATGQGRNRVRDTCRTRTTPRDDRPDPDVALSVVLNRN